MNKLVLASAAVATIMAATASDAQAWCFGRSNHGGCAPAQIGCNDCSPCVSYQQVWKEREVTVTVLTRVPRQENFEYTVCVPVTTAEKRKVTVCKTVTREVEFKYIECVPEMRAEKRKVIQYTCVPTTVECDVPCYTTVMVPCCTPCGGMSYTCQRVCTMQRVQRTVMKQVPQEVEVTVNICTYNRVEKVGKRMVCDLVPEEREITVNVCHMTTEKRTGTRTIIDCVPTQEKRMVKYCEMVPVAAAPVAPVAPMATVATSYDACNTCNTCNTGCTSSRGCFSGCRLGGCFSGCR